MGHIPWLREGISVVLTLTLCALWYFSIGNPLLYMGVLHKNWKFRLLLILEVFPTLGCA